MTETAKRSVIRPGDVPTETFGWGSLTWVSNAKVTGTENLTVGLVTMNPGQSNPKHSHPNCDEVLYMIQGEVDHSLGGDMHHLKAGDFIVIPRGVPHDAVNTGTELVKMLVTYDTGVRETEFHGDSTDE